MKADPETQATPRLGAMPDPAGVEFAVWSQDADRLWLCLFDTEGNETERLAMTRGRDAVHRLRVPGLGIGACYGYRADGLYDPAEGFCFDPDKLLVDPYATAIDRPFVQDPALAAPRGSGRDTAGLVPKSLVMAEGAPRAGRPRPLPEGALIYEVPVRGFTMRHRGVDPGIRGTLAALTEPAVLDHLRRLRVDAVELMPVAAWIDERHLPPLGLANAWGYNPVTFMALDPRLAPGGPDDLRRVAEALHDAGIALLLDVVFNHTGEADAAGATLSLRGLGCRSYFARDPGGGLTNVTGTGNTLDFTRPVVRRLALDAMRHLAGLGVDGFRFDLAPVLGRTADGFEADAPFFREIAADPLLSRCALIAEPWDIGHDGYQLGRFPGPFLEWNDRFRDDVRRFWRGDDGSIGALATRLSGSSDIFGGRSARRSRSVNFVAAHDGMTLADITAYTTKHNAANGEDNRDGHDDNLSWNCGVEGATGEEAVLASRRRDARALLATLFLSRGAILLTAGDEFGRTQRGNNNAYAQDNEITWLDWARRDIALENWTVALSELRRRCPSLRSMRFLSGKAWRGGFPDVEWRDEHGRPMTPALWEEPGRRCLAMVLATGETGRLAVLVNGDEAGRDFELPSRDGYRWRCMLPEIAGPAGVFNLAPRSIAVIEEERERE